MQCYGDVFGGVRQRVAAFKYWREYLGGHRGPYGMEPEDEYLDDAYRFLNMSISKTFLAFCAAKEGMGVCEYFEMLGIDMDSGVERKKKCHPSQP